MPEDDTDSDYATSSLRRSVRCSKKNKLKKHGTTPSRQPVILVSLLVYARAFSLPLESRY